MVLSALMILVQLGWFVFIFLRLRTHQPMKVKDGQSSGTQRSSNKKSLTSRFSTIPSFNNNLQKKLWDKLTRDQRKDAPEVEDEMSAPPSIDDLGLLGKEEKGVLSDDEEPPEVKASWSKQDRPAATVACQSPNNERPLKQRLVLPIYQRYLRLQAGYCVGWIIFIAALLLKDESEIVTWGRRGDEKVDTSFVVGASALMGIGSLLDGALVFLCQTSVGRTSINRADRFSYIWALVTFASCFILATLNSTDTGFYANNFNPPDRKSVV